MIVRIQASGGLSDADIERMVKDAEKHAVDDKKRRALVEARNHGEAVVHATEKSLVDLGAKVSAADKSLIDNAIADLKLALKSDDMDAIKAKTDALQQQTMKLGEAMYQAYQQQAGSEGGGSGASGGSSDDKVVDADFEEVKDPNKKKSA